MVKGASARSPERSFAERAFGMKLSPIKSHLMPHSWWVSNPVALGGCLKAWLSHPSFSHSSAGTLKGSQLHAGLQNGETSCQLFFFNSHTQEYFRGNLISMFLVHLHLTCHGILFQEPFGAQENL